MPFHKTSAGHFDLDPRSPFEESARPSLPFELMVLAWTHKRSVQLGEHFLLEDLSCLEKWQIPLVNREVLEWVLT